MLFNLQGQQAGEAGFDMFSADQVDDMFGDAPVGAPVPSQNAPKRGLVDNFDDSEGYYNFQVQFEHPSVFRVASLYLQIPEIIVSKISWQTE